MKTDNNLKIEIPKEMEVAFDSPFDPSVWLMNEGETETIKINYLDEGCSDNPRLCLKLPLVMKAVKICGRINLRTDAYRLEGTYKGLRSGVADFRMAFIETWNLLMDGKRDEIDPELQKAAEALEENVYILNLGLDSKEIDASAEDEISPGECCIYKVYQIADNNDDFISMYFYEPMNFFIFRETEDKYFCRMEKLDFSGEGSTLDEALDNAVDAFADYFQTYMPIYCFQQWNDGDWPFDYCAAHAEQLAKEPPLPKETESLCADIFTMVWSDVMKRQIWGMAEEEDYDDEDEFWEEDEIREEDPETEE